PGGARRREEDHGLRAPDLPRRGSPLANPEADGEGARLAAGRGRRGARGRGSEGAAGAPSRARARDERRVLLGDRPRCRRDPASARAGDVRLLPRRRLVGAHPRAETDRAPVPAVGALRRPSKSVAAVGLLTLGEAAAAAEGLAGDDEADRELRAAAKRIAELLKKKGR